MKVDVMFLGPNGDREAALFNANNLRRTCAMLGIDLDEPEETTPPAAATVDPEKLERFNKAVSKLKDIRKAIEEHRSDLKIGSTIAVDGFVFVV